MRTRFNEAPNTPLVAPPSGLTAFESAGFGYVAHRNLPNVYPEETLIGARCSLAAGAQWVDCDAQVLADGALANWHDVDIDRCSSGTGLLQKQTSSSFAKLNVDASSFLGGGWTDTVPAFFSDYLKEFGNRVPISVEAKANDGGGAKIVQALQRYGIAPDMVLVSSFFPAELTAALAAGYPTMLSFGNYNNSPTPAQLKATGYRWVCSNNTTSLAQLDALRAAGLKVAVYTLNTRAEAAPFLGHCDAIYTDDEIYLRGIARRSTDPFAAQMWYHGHQASNPSQGAAGGRGTFYAPNMWGYDMSGSNTFAGALQGWANPIGGAETCPSMTINLSAKYETGFAEDRFASVYIATTDTPIVSNTQAPIAFSGYHFFLRKNGILAINRYDAGQTSSVNIAVLGSGTAIANAQTVPMQIVITPTNVTFKRTDTNEQINAADATYRGSYLSLGVVGLFGKFSGVSITTP